MLIIIVSSIITFVIVFIIFTRKNPKLNNYNEAEKMGKLIAILSAIILISINGFLTMIASLFFNNQKFVLDNYNKYIIYHEKGNEIISVYEVDFEKDKIVCRKGVNNNTRYEYKGKILDKYNSSIQNEIKDIIGNDINLNEISEEEKVEYFKNHIYTFYAIKTYDNIIYYVRDMKQIKKLDELLRNYENKIYY